MMLLYEFVMWTTPEKVPWTGPVSDSTRRKPELTLWFLLLLLLLPLLLGSAAEAFSALLALAPLPTAAELLALSICCRESWLVGGTEAPSCSWAVAAALLACRPCCWGEAEGDASMSEKGMEVGGQSAAREWMVSVLLTEGGELCAMCYESHYAPAHVLAAFYQSSYTFTVSALCFVLACLYLCMCV
jgi:hypothetical protein